MMQGVQTDKKVNRNVDGWISDLVGALTDPVICHEQNLDRPPAKIMEAVTLQRLIENMLAVKENRQPLGTDAEAAWYLSCASLSFPLSEQWTRIYMYAFNKTCQIIKMEVPEDLRQEKLDSYDMGFLHELKEWIYRMRSENRKESARQERREAREETKQKEAEQKIELQPAMFQF